MSQSHTQGLKREPLIEHIIALATDTLADLTNTPEQYMNVIAYLEGQMKKIGVDPRILREALEVFCSTTPDQARQYQLQLQLQQLQQQQLQQEQLQQQQLQQQQLQQQQLQQQQQQQKPLLVGPKAPGPPLVFANHDATIKKFPDISSYSKVSTSLLERLIPIDPDDLFKGLKPEDFEPQS